jgi:hypothetical protein
LRLHAEKAITLLAEARAVARNDRHELANTEALDAIELGARRIDFIGSKFIAADECTRLYAKAQTLAGDKSHWNEVADALYSIGSNNGRIEDIRDGYSQIGQLFHDAWLRDNRPYWLANNMARYDRAAQLWVGRGAAWQNVIRRWYETRTLTPAGDAGLPSPVEK